LRAERFISQQGTVIGQRQGWLSEPAPGVFARFGELIKHRGALALLDQAAVSAASFLTTVLIGRFAHPENLGLFSLAWSIVLGLLALQMSLLTTPYAVHRHRSDINPRTYAASTIVMQLTMLTLVVVALIAAALLTSGVVRVAAWAMLFATPLLLLREFARRMAYARLSVGSALAIDLPVVIAQLGAVALLAKYEALTGMTALFAVGAAAGIGAIVGCLSLRRHITFDRAALSPDVRRSWSFGRWIAASQLLEVANTHGTFWLVAAVLGTESTGVYAACLAIVMLCNPFMLAVGNVLTPRAAQVLARDGKPALRRLIFRAIAMLIGVMSIFCVTVCFGGEWVVQMLYGDEYRGHGVVIAVLSLTFFCGALSMAFNDGMRALGRADMEFRATVLDTLLTIGLGLVGLMSFGLFGLACASLAGSVAALGLQARTFMRLSRES
jgi:O-antigen/teichoic acid export membrane protein